jgi:hypothetical protein
MTLAFGRISTCLLTLVAILGMAFGRQADAQVRAGVVTTLEGHVTVARASLPKPAPLKFKDDIFVLDRIATGKDSVARILLGGRAVVTVREHSTVTITEVPGVATVDVAAGRVAVAVAREKMRAGDLVEVKTPNAVAGIRGTVVVAEVFGVDRSVVTVLKGTVDVRRLEAGRLVGTATIVNALQRVTIAGRGAVSAPERVTPAAASQLGGEFRLAPPRATPQAAIAAVNAGEVARAAKDHAGGPRRGDVDRRIRANVVDTDSDDVATLPARGGREKRERHGKGDTGPRGRGETTYEAPAVVKPYSRSAEPIFAVPEPMKYSERNSERSGRGKGGRDR